MSGPGSGSWTRLSLLAAGLVARGVEVHVLGELGVHDQADSWGTTSVQLIPRLSKVNRFIGRGRRIAAFVRSTGCEVVHIEAPPFTGLRKVICIASIHDLREMAGGNAGRITLSRFYYQQILSRYAPHIDGWLALSNYGSLEIEKRLRVSSSSVHLVPPIVAGPLRAQSAPSLGLPPYVLALGHLEERKNLGVLIKAAGNSRWPHDVELWIAGKDQGQLPGLSALAARTPTPVRFLGEVDEDKKWQLMRQASLVAVPSLLEGFGLVAVEGPLAGTPALVSNRTALVELAAHPYAQVEAENPSEWAEKIAALIGDERRRAEILDAQNHLARSFSSETVTSNLMALYDRLLKESRTRAPIGLQQRTVLRGESDSKNE